MKIFAVLALSLLSTSAFASSYNALTCKGIDGSEGKVLYTKLVSGEEIREGDDMTFLLVLRDGSETLYSGYVKGESEDVLLFLKNRRGQEKISANFYLDELNETSVTFNGEKYNFDCRYVD